MLQKESLNNVFLLELIMSIRQQEVKIEQLYNFLKEGYFSIDKREEMDELLYNMINTHSRLTETLVQEREKIAQNNNENVDCRVIDNLFSQ